MYTSTCSRRPATTKKLTRDAKPKTDTKTQNGRTRARFRADVKINKIVMVSTSGWWEMGNFGTVLRIVKEFTKDANTEFAGALLRPHAGSMAENKEKAGKVSEAARQSGYELVKEGRISKGLLKIIGQPLISEEKWRKG